LLSPLLPAFKLVVCWKFKNHWGYSMKKTLVTFFALALVVAGQDAFAQRQGGGRGGSTGRGGGHTGGGHTGGHGGGHTGGGHTGGHTGGHGGGHTGHHTGYGGGYSTVTCAPEVLSNNLQATDQALSQLAANELKANSAFTATVANVAAIQSSQEKTEAYLGLVGVDASDAEAVLNFLYAREVSASAVLTVQKNLDLNAEQATLVIDKMTQALRPLN
jgi:hypothetical protein